MSQRAQSNYIPALTGVRAMAAYLVFISHFAYIFDESFPHIVQRFLGEFHIGVSIFFVLSGFLIAFRYYNNFPGLNREWFMQYLKNRVARIYPMYFLLTVAAFVYYFITKDETITKGYEHPVALMLMNITFIRGFFYQFWDTGIAQGWSLTVEECFYFSAPIIFLIVRRYGKFYIQPVVITLTGILLYFIFSHVSWNGFLGNFTFVMLFTFFGRCFEFFVGIQLARYVLKKGFTRTNKVNYTYTGFLLIFVCVFIMALQPVPKGWIAGVESPVGIIVNNYFLCIAVALFFYGILTETTLFKKFLALPFIELLGKSSYIFYLVHLGWIYNLLHNGFNSLNDHVFELYDKWGVDWHSPFEYDTLNLLYAFIVLNIISVTLFKLVEEPLNHYIRKSGFLVKYKPSSKKSIV
ncbi:acyltransferase family protein [Mucilaginibacter pocheonensis]|uniref:Peptidoglycan/LPS O-acetylase OafA/YrhL n=1 Tax=Mucilaginibacter pocheonensis TaxID=398050 RepID=A0ABU1TIL6_9SPHI|nr:acyltransferase [Mucilaginibacter pocheonensis]MDR6945264.1 peptidoglycan/LPS O-acetylase OafA/YrhL [Mucilaginibacter pocheonensis]